jgi:hypothetical protein
LEAAMKKTDIDLSGVESVMNSNKNKISFSENHDKFIRVAFDLFRLKGGEEEDLWQVQADDDGNEFLVRTFSLPEETVKESEWLVISDKKCASLNIFYKDVPIKKIAMEDLKIESPDDVDMLRRAIKDKLLKNKSFAVKLLINLPNEKYEALRPTGIFEKLKESETKDIVNCVYDLWMKIHKLLNIEPHKCELMKEHYHHMYNESPEDFKKKHTELLEKVKGLEEDEKSQDAKDNDPLGIGKVLHEDRKEKEVERKSRINKSFEKLLEDKDSPFKKEKENIKNLSKEDLDSLEVALKKVFPEEDIMVGRKLESNFSLSKRQLK